jgi:hypothetical protein
MRKRHGSLDRRRQRDVMVDSRRRAMRLGCAAALAIGGLAPAAQAQCQLALFSAQPASGGDNVGWSVAVNSKFAVVGAYYGTGLEFGTGSALVLKRVGMTWQPFDALFALDGLFGDYFGSAVCIDGDHLLVGSFRHPHSSGEGDVYCYSFNGSDWVFDGKLTPPPNVQVNQFGYAIAAQQGVAVISAFRDDHGILSGAAFIYRRVGRKWLFEQRLIPSDAPEALIGWSVAIDGNIAVAGSLSTSAEEFERGAAYVFELAALGQWNHVATLRPIDVEQGIGFGGAVGIKNEWAAVGSYKDSVPGHQSGSVHMFRREPGGLWRHHARLVASDGASHDYFGNALAINNDSLIVGARGRDDANAKPAGAAYAFRRKGDTWTQEMLLTPSSLGAGDNFGWAVALTSDLCLVGAPGHDIPLGDAGAAYAYSIQTCDCNGNAQSDACEMASGELVDANLDGVPDICQTLGCPADCLIPADGLVNAADLIAVVESWDQEFPLCDISRAGVDGTVGLDDLLAVLEAWGRCP